MSSGTRLTAVRVGLSIVALDEEVKTPDFNGMQSQQRMLLLWATGGYICIGVTMLTLIRKLIHKIIVIFPGCNVAFFLQILRTSHCLSHACKLIPYTLCLYNYSFCVCCQFASSHSTTTTLTHMVCYFSSLLSLCAVWRICPPDCCQWRAPRRGQGPRSSVPRLAHGEWNRPVLHGPRWW